MGGSLHAEDADQPPDGQLGSGGDAAAAGPKASEQPAPAEDATAEVVSKSDPYGGGEAPMEVSQSDPYGGGAVEEAGSGGGASAGDAVGSSATAQPKGSAAGEEADDADDALFVVDTQGAAV